jgi:hypothetical protein
MQHKISGSSIIYPVIQRRSYGLCSMGIIIKLQPTFKGQVGKATYKPGPDKKFVKNFLILIGPTQACCNISCRKGPHSVPNVSRLIHLNIE